MMRPAYVQRMARYNRWQNENLYNVADCLSDEERRLDRGAFFRSIHGTFNHLVWGDTMWMSRFTDVAKPPGMGGAQSAFLHERWDDLKDNRVSLDQRILAWADALDEAWLDGDVNWYSGGAKRDITKPAWLLVTHFFNHQTHHRGQVHAMLTSAGGKPHDTDLFLMPE